MTPPTSAVQVQAARRLPPGRPFAPGPEAELMDSLIQLAQSVVPPSARCLAIPELVGPYGVADLVVAVDKSGGFARRLDADIPPLRNRNDADIVGVLPTRVGLTIEEIAAVLLWADPIVVEKRLRVLLRIDVVSRNARGKFLRHPQMRPADRIHAFESKVRDWRGGIDQARTYALWADTATLVLGALPRRPDTLRSEADSWRLGLAERESWVARPRLRHHRQGRRLWASEHVVAALRGDDS